MFSPPDAELRGVGGGGLREEGGGETEERRGPFGLLFQANPCSKSALLCQKGFALEEPFTFQ